MAESLQQSSQDRLPDVKQASFPIPLIIEERACEHAAADIPKNFAQNTGAALVNPNSNQSLMLQNKTVADGLGFMQRFTNYWSRVDTSLHEEPPRRTGVVTFQDLAKSVPTIRVKLENKALAKHPCEPELMLEVKKCVDGMFRKAEEDLHLEQEPAKEALERNERQLDAIFDSIEQRIRQLREQVKMKFRKLTLPQQKEALAFWKAAEEFISMLLDWLGQMFNVVLDKIRQGYTIEKDAIKGLFKVVAEMLRIIF